MEQNILQILSEDNRFRTLLSLIDQAGLSGVLERQGAYTLFAPTDQAFESVDPNLLTKLSDPRNAQMLKDAILYHVVPFEITSQDIQESEGTMTPATLQGKSLCIFVADDGNIQVNNAFVEQAEIDGINGVVFTIDKVLNPLNGGQQCMVSRQSQSGQSQMQQSQNSYGDYDQSQFGQGYNQGQYRQGSTSVSSANNGSLYATSYTNKRGNTTNRKDYNGYNWNGY